HSNHSFTTVMLRAFVFSTTSSSLPSYFLFHAPATTEIYTLSLHDALPISEICVSASRRSMPSSPGSSDNSVGNREKVEATAMEPDRKSTRLNSSHEWISYAVFCLKKKKKTQKQHNYTLYQRTKPSHQYSYC